MAHHFDFGQSGAPFFIAERLKHQINMATKPAYGSAGVGRVLVCSKELIATGQVETRQVNGAKLLRTDCCV